MKFFPYGMLCNLPSVKIVTIVCFVCVSIFPGGERCLSFFFQAKTSQGLDKCILMLYLCSSRKWFSVG